MKTIYQVFFISLLMIKSSLASPLKWQSKDEAYSLKVTGFLQADTGWINRDTTNYTARGELTRARLGVRGNLDRDFDYFVQYDFGNDNRKFTYLSVGYNGLDGMKFRVGQFKEPFSLDLLTSAPHTTFMDRASLNALVPKFSLGAQITAPSGDFVFTGGIFGGNLNAFHPDEDKHAVTGRVTYTPIVDQGKTLHLGLALSTRWLNDETKRVRFRSKPEVTFTRVHAIDTAGLALSNRQHLLGLESAYEQGPFSIQGQYTITQVERDSQDAILDGYYLQAAYRLTGETRPYKKLAGVFGGITPLASVADGGGGAIEIAARYSHLDLNDKAVQGGVLDTMTAGVNWYPLAKTKVSFNTSYASAETMTGTDNPVSFGLRLQFAF